MAAVITAEMREQISELYVAMFGRAPAAAGMSYWVGQLASGYSMAQVAQFMYDNQSAEDKAFYPSFFTPSDVVKSFFTNVLGRPPAAEGLAYWTTQLTNEIVSGNPDAYGKVIYDMIYSTVHYNGTNQAGLDSKALFLNKAAVAEYYAVVLQGDFTDSKIVLNGITKDTDTTTAAAKQAIIDANIAAFYDDPPAFASSSITASAAENQTGVVTVVATDPEGDAISYSIAGGADAGKFSINATTGVLTFASAPNYEAPGSAAGTNTYSVVVKATANGKTATQDVTVNVVNVNEAPVANPSSASGLEDGTIGGTVTASDVDGGTLTYSVVTGPAHGTVQLNTDGSYVYTPDANYVGSDSFTFRASDGQLNSNVATIGLTVTNTNDAPVAQNVVAAGAEDAASILVTPVSTDIDANDTAAYSVNSQPAHGTVSWNGTQFVYVPNANFNGTDSFTYKVTDAAGASSTATASITVTAVNDAPLAFNLEAAGIEDNVITGQVGATDVEGDPLVYTVLAAPTNGNVTLNPDGTFEYTPADNYYGEDQFTYTVSDGNGGTDTGTVTLTIVSQNDVLTPDVDNVTGSSVDDVWIGNANTLNAGDSIDGGDGNDKLIVGISGGNEDDVEFAAFVLHNVEELEVTNDGGGPAVFDMSSSDDVLTLRSVNSTEDVKFNFANMNPGSNYANLDVLNLTDGVSVSLDLRNDDVDGNADEVNLLVTDSDDNSLDADEINIYQFGTDPNDTAASARSGIETVNLATYSGASATDEYGTARDSSGEVRINDLNTPGATTVKILTAEDLTIGDTNGNLGTFTAPQIENALSASVGTVDASGSTGDIALSTAANDSGAWVGMGSGSDFIVTGDGADEVHGNGGHDSINTGAGDDTIEGGDGNDRIDAGGDNNAVYGDAGHDSIIAGTGNDYIEGGEGNDTIDASSGNNEVYGNEDDDTITVAAGSQYVDAGSGNDVVNISELTSNWNSNGGDTLIGGADNDTLNISGPDSDSTNSGGGAGKGNEFDRVTQFENIVFAAGNDYAVQITNGSDFDADTTGVTVDAEKLNGNTLDFDGSALDRAITVLGGQSNDTIVTGAGDDSVDGNGGNDTITTNGGDDTVQIGSGSDSVSLGTGHDNVIVYNGELGIDDTIDGGDGNDTITLVDDSFADNSYDSDSATLGGGISDIEVVKIDDQDDEGSVEVIFDASFTQAAITVDGTDLDSSQYLYVYAENNAASENITILGGAAGDYFYMGDNLSITDSIDGNSGWDTIIIDGTVVDADFTNVQETEQLTLTGPVGDSATLGAQAQEAGILAVQDGSGNDTINASAYTEDITIYNYDGGNDSITTGSGDDTVYALVGNDSVKLGSGDDVVYSNSNWVDDFDANDSIDGGAGSDTVRIYNSQPGNETVVVDLDNVKSVENYVLTDANGWWDQQVEVTNITFQDGNVTTINTINVDARILVGGEDWINVDLSAIGDKDYAFNIWGGAGADTVTGSIRPENLNFQAGAGDDRLNIDSTDMGTTVTMDGGAGFDTVNMISGKLTDDSFDNFSHIEHLTATGVPLDAELGEQADDAMDESTQGGWVSITGTAGDDKVVFDAAYDDTTRVNLATGGNDSVDASASMVTVIVQADATDIDANDTLMGGANGDDALWLTADDPTPAIAGDNVADLSNVSGFETVQVIEAGDQSIEILITDSTFTDVADGVITVNANGLNDTGTELPEGGMRLHGSSVTAGAFHVMGGTGDDTIHTGSGDDTIHAGSGDDSVLAGAGDDYVMASPGDDTLKGEDGDDTLISTEGEDWLYGGAGSDYLDAGNGDDQLAGDDDGQAGAPDTLMGGDGNDVLYGGAGNDELTGGSGDDTYIYTRRSDSSGLQANIDTIFGFGGDDVIDFRYVGLDPEVIGDWAGVNGATIEFQGNAINFADAQASVYNNNGIVEVVFQKDEQILWVDLNDDGSLDENDLRIKLNGVTAVTAAQVLDGSTLGAWVITEDDVEVNGTIVNDTIIVDADNVTVNGGGGDDDITIQDPSSGTEVNGGDGDDTVNGSSQGDTINGGFGDDVINGGDGNDMIDGGYGDDSLMGGDGNDTIHGGDGDDTVDGGAGDDSIVATPGMDLVWGGTGNDTIHTGAEDDTAYGGAGDDSMDGGTGSDMLWGDEGDDTILGNDGDDTIEGGDGNDTIYGGDGADDIDGGAGNDDIYGNDGADAIDGGDGDDWVNGGDGADDINGGAGNDDIYGNDDDDTIAGGAGDDSIWGGNGADDIDGGTGNDSLYGGAGNDTMNGGDGNDGLFDNDGNSPGDDSVSGGAGDDHIWTTYGSDTLNGGDGDDTIWGFGSFFGDDDMGDVINGGAGNDDVHAGDGDDTVDGGTGDDTIFGSDGDDTIDGGAGNDFIGGNDGDDVILGNDGNDTIEGGAGNDDIAGNDGNDDIDGGAGDDTIRGFNLGDEVDGADNDDTLVMDQDVWNPLDSDIRDVEYIVFDGGGIDVRLWQQTEDLDITLSDDGDFVQSGSGDDTITGGDADDTISGGDGNDDIAGGGGDDSIDGGNGDDTIAGGAGDDSIGGGNGADDIDGGTGNDWISGGNDDDTIAGGAGDDSIFGGDGADDIDGGDDRDWISGGNDDDTIAGGAGDDSIDGGNGDDDIDGGAGDDSIWGGSGNDDIDGGAGDDTLDGGLGADRFVVNTAATADGHDGVDTILDFALGDGDILQLVSEWVDDTPTRSEVVTVSTAGASGDDIGSAAVVLVDTAVLGSGYVDTAADVDQFIFNQLGSGNIGPDGLYVVTSDGNDSFVWYVEEASVYDQLNPGSDVTLLATLTGILDPTGLSLDFELVSVTAE